MNIVASMIRMTKSIGVQTIAEGIENQGQEDVLSGLGCDKA